MGYLPCMVSPWTPLDFVTNGKDREDFTVLPPFQTERASFDALRFPAQGCETALLHRDPAHVLRSLGAHRLPWVNIPTGAGVGGRCGTSRLADLHPVPMMTTR